MPCNCNSVPCSVRTECNETKGHCIGSHPSHVTCAKIIPASFLDASNYFTFWRLVLFQARLFGHIQIIFLNVFISVHGCYFAVSLELFGLLVLLQVQCAFC